MGPLLLGRLFDTVGRKPMIAGTYIGSALVLTVLTFLFADGTLGIWGFMALLLLTFFLASAGASAAYLTVSEIFPMETRALAIAFFYAIGTAVGGITGPFLFGKMIESGEESQVAIAFFIGAGVMAMGGIVELFLGVKAEQESLEDIAKPLTAQDAEEGEPGRREAGAPSGREEAAAPGPRRHYRFGPGRTSSSPACSSQLRPRSRSSARSRRSSAYSPIVSRPSGASWRGSSGHASGARVASRPHCARRSSQVARAALRATASARRSQQSSHPPPFLLANAPATLRSPARPCDRQRGRAIASAAVAEPMCARPPRSPARPSPRRGPRSPFARRS